MAARAENAEKLSLRLAPPHRNADAQLAAQVAAGERLRVGEQRLAGAGKDQISSVLARAGAQIENIVGGENGFGIVLDHEQRIAQVAQPLEDLDQAARVARVQADGRLVEDVERAHQARAQRRGELNPLRFAAGKRRGQPVQREVVEPHFVEKAQPLLNFFQDLFGDHRFGGAQLQAVEKRPRFLHRHPADFCDRAPSDLHGAGLGAQARAMAVGTSGVAAIAAEKYAHVQLVLFPLQPGEKALHAQEIFLAVALEDRVALRRGQVAEGNVDGNALGARVAAHVHGDLAVARLGPRLDGAVGERFGFVRHDAVEIEIHRVAEALAARAGAVGIVEREEARLGLLIRRAALLAVESLVEHQPVGSGCRRAGRFLRHEFQNGLAAPFAVADLDRIDQPRANLGPERQAVHQRKDGLGEIHVEQFLGRGKLEYAAGLIQPVEAALAQIDERLADQIGAGARRLARPRGSRPAPAGRRDRRRLGGEFQLVQNVEAAACGKRQHARGDFVERVLADFLAALQAEGVSRAGVEQAQVVVDFGGGGHGRARIARRILLANGDGRSDSGDLVDVRLLDAFQELPRVGR